MSSFIVTTALEKLYSLNKRKKVIQGGTWASKTFSIIAHLINDCCEYDNKKITVIAETIPAIKNGALNDFKTIMMETERWMEDSYNGSDRVYSFANGSEIQFSSFDSIGKAKAAGKRTDLFINEANYIDYAIADALIMRTEGSIWIDFNPTNEFWAHTEILTQPDAEFLLLRYTDNEALPDTILAELKNKQEKAKTSEYWRNWCRIYIDGEIGGLEGLVLPNFKIVPEIPIGAKLISTGLDFGFTNDPSAMVSCYMSDGKRYFDEIFCEQGLLNRMIVNKIRAAEIKGTIWADSAEPKSIAEIKGYGIDIRPVEKGKDSIAFGISLLQEEDFYVTQRSLNLIKELRNYCWEKDKSGAPLNSPIDSYNHCVDAIRYIALMNFKKRNIIKPASGGFVPLRRKTF